MTYKKSLLLSAAACALVFAVTPAMAQTTTKTVTTEQAAQVGAKTINLNNFAACLQSQGRSAEAEPLFVRALDIKEALLGPNHPDVAMTLHNLAVLDHEAGRHADARLMYERAIDIFAATLDAEHPKLTTCRANLAEL